MAETLLNPTIVINRYFGRKPGQSNADFLVELRALSEEEKLYLARGAAQAFGLKQDQVLFSLK